MIRRLKNNKIDKTKWDQVITGSDNPHVYLLSWYLDIVSPGWQCLVYGDYEMALPLPVKKKWGMPYLVQPPFCQKIRITGIGVKSSVARQFYNRIKWLFPYFNLQIGDASGLEKKRFLNGRINYTLDLSASYNTLKKDYSENTLRNIKKAWTKSRNFENWTDEGFLNFCDTSLTGLSEKQKVILRILVKENYRRNIASIFRITGKTGKTTAAACFLVWNFQVLYLAGASNHEGKTGSSMFLLMDKVIEKFAGTGFLLDFEGSMIPGVARFFRGFGAKASYYYAIKKYLFVLR